MVPLEQGIIFHPISFLRLTALQLRRTASTLSAATATDLLRIATDWDARADELEAAARTEIERFADTKKPASASRKSRSVSRRIVRVKQGRGTARVPLSGGSTNVVLSEVDKEPCDVNSRAVLRRKSARFDAAPRGGPKDR